MASLLACALYEKLINRADKFNQLRLHDVESLGQNTFNCRVCNQEGAHISIFTTTAEGRSILEEINFFSGLMNESSDKFSSFICKNCLQLLKICLKFRNLCHNTKKYIVKSFKLSKDLQEDGDNLMEKAKVGSIMKKETKTDNSDTDCSTNSIDQTMDSDSYSLPSPTYTELSSWKCVYCSNIYYEENTYNKHLVECQKKLNKTSPNEKTKQTYLCDTCGKTSSTLHTLRAHKLIHINIFPFRCNMCPYQGRTKLLLKSHMASHLPEEERQYRCPICNKTKTTATNLAVHIKRLHGDTESSKMVKCTQCDKVFRYEVDMKRHLENVHTDKKMVQCDVCQKIMNKRHLRSHLRKIHKLEPPKLQMPNRLPSYVLSRMAEFDRQSSKHQENAEENYRVI